METKLITPELINERLEAKGFGEKQAEDLDTIRESVLKYFGYQLTDSWTDNAEYYVYPESTADGYEVFIATCDTSRINICEDVYYYESDLGDVLAEAIKYGNGGDDVYPEVIYVGDLDASYVDEAMESLFQYLSIRFEEEVIDELKDEGYEYKDAEAIA